MQNIQKLKPLRFSCNQKCILFEVQRLKYKNQNLKSEAQKLKHLLAAQATGWLQKLKSLHLMLDQWAGCRPMPWGLVLNLWS